MALVPLSPWLCRPSSQIGPCHPGRRRGCSRTSFGRTPRLRTARRASAPPTWHWCRYRPGSAGPPVRSDLVTQGAGAVVVARVLDELLGCGQRAELQRLPHGTGAAIALALQALQSDRTLSPRAPARL